MKAARYYGKEDVRIEDIPLPIPKDGQVQIRVAFNGICGSDLHEYYDGPRAVPTGRHPLTGVTMPVVLGHEAAGHVSAVGPRVPSDLEGQLVAIDPVRPCRECCACQASLHNLCDRLAMHGYSTDGGGLAQYTVVPWENVHAIPPGLTPGDAALVEPLAVAYHAVRRWERPEHPSAAVFGGGPIGVSILLTLRATGVEDVLVVEPAPERRAIAAALGARVVDPSSGDPVETIREMTAGRGVGVSFETAGAATTFRSAVSATAKQGTVVVVASGRHEVIAPLGEMLRSELTIRTTYASCGDFPAVINLMSKGAFPLEGWVSTIALDELLAGFESLRSGRSMKLLVDPWA